VADDFATPLAPLSRRAALTGIGAASVATSMRAEAQASSSANAAGHGAAVSIIDFGADPSGRNDSSAAFRRALREAGGGHVAVPQGRYLVERIAGLGPAGQKIVGESRFKTVFLSEAGGGPLFASEVSATGTSAFHLLSDFMIDLNGNDVVAIDLAGINCSTVQRVHIKGGSAQSARGTGVRFAAPLRRGAYDNAVHDCSFEYLRRGVQWDSGANNNSLFNCRVSNCEIALHADPPGSVDTPRVFGGRVEGCGTGLVEGAHCGAYFAVRFEDNDEADIRFTERSVNAGVWGGLTADAALVLADLERARSPFVESSELGFLAIEESAARPKISTGRHVFAKAGKPPQVLPQRDFAAQFDDYVVFRNQTGIEFANSAKAGSIVGMLATGGDNLAIPGFDRSTRQYVTIELGGGPSIRPLKDATTDLGTKDARYRTLRLSDGIDVGGQAVIGARQPAVADDRSGTATAAKVNEILAVLRRHGLIES
jgi:hypothetical protein